MAHETVHGYKGFESDMSCRGFQYEVGKTYEHRGGIGLCEAGFHFCRKMADVFNYYKGEDKRYAEVEAFGDVIYSDDKSVTDKLYIVRELTRQEVFEEMACAGMDFESIPFPADEIIKARESGKLDDLLPSGTEFPVRFANGECNVLVACRDKDHTYLVTKYLMAEPFAMNGIWTNEGGWPACRMRKHVNKIYDMLPESFRKAVIPMHIKQVVQRETAECDDMAFLLSSANVFGKHSWNNVRDYNDSQIDIFQKPAAGIKGRLGASSASWWWLRSASSNYDFIYVYSDGDYFSTRATSEGGVVVGICIEDRKSRN